MVPSPYIGDTNSGCLSVKDYMVQSMYDRSFHYVRESQFGIHSLPLESVVVDLNVHGEMKYVLSEFKSSTNGHILSCWISRDNAVHASSSVKLL
jgi:hypothetical protein